MADVPNVSLAPVIVGGLIALGGVILTGIITFGAKIFENRAANKKRLGEKFEELVAAVYQYDHWIDNLRRIKAYGEQGTMEVSPMSKIEAIAAVYFPTFNKKIAQVSDAGRVYELWIAKAALKRLEGKLSEVNEGFNEAYVPYGDRRKELLEDLRQFANKEFQ